MRASNFVRAHILAPQPTTKIQNNPFAWYDLIPKQIHTEPIYSLPTQERIKQNKNQRHNFDQYHEYDDPIDFRILRKLSLPLRFKHPSNNIVDDNEDNDDDGMTTLPSNKPPESSNNETSVEIQNSNEENSPNKTEEEPTEEPEVSTNDSTEEPVISTDETMEEPVNSSDEPIEEPVNSSDEPLQHENSIDSFIHNLFEEIKNEPQEIQQQIIDELQKEESNEPIIDDLLDEIKNETPEIQQQIIDEIQKEDSNDPIINNIYDEIKDEPPEIQQEILDELLKEDSDSEITIDDLPEEIKNQPPEIQQELIEKYMEEDMEEDNNLSPIEIEIRNKLKNLHHVDEADLQPKEKSFAELLQEKREHLKHVNPEDHEPATMTDISNHGITQQMLEEQIAKILKRTAPDDIIETEGGYFIPKKRKRVLTQYEKLKHLYPKQIEEFALLHPPRPKSSPTVIERIKKWWNSSSSKPAKPNPSPSKSDVKDIIPITGNKIPKEVKRNTTLEQLRLMPTYDENNVKIDIGSFLNDKVSSETLREIFNIPLTEQKKRKIPEIDLATTKEFTLNQQNTQNSTPSKNLALTRQQTSTPSKKTSTPSKKIVKVNMFIPTEDMFQFQNVIDEYIETPDNPDNTTSLQNEWLRVSTKSPMDQQLQAQRMINALLNQYETKGLFVPTNSLIHNSEKEFNSDELERILERYFYTDFPLSERQQNLFDKSVGIVFNPNYNGHKSYRYYFHPLLIKHMWNPADKDSPLEKNLRYKKKFNFNN